MPKIVNTYSSDYPLIEGKPFTDYNADEEFLFQMEKHFPRLFKFEVLSKKGKGSRTDALLKGRFASDEFSKNTFFVYTFILYEGGAGRSHDDELRTQLTPGTSWSTDLARYKAATNFRDANGELKNLECYCIGIYKQDKNCKNVLFAGMPAEVLCKSETEKISPTSVFQTYGENAREAYIKGIYLHEKKFTASNSFNLLLFKPEYFLWYMRNRDELHIGDIEKAMNVVKNAPHIVTPQFLLTKEVPLQQIFYGAPGTGKSHEISKQTEGKAVVRTTFHPDSDYSTFVGAYKPSIGKGRVYGAQGPLTENGKPIEEPIITYQFVKQAFLKAYLGAWKKYSDGCSIVSTSTIREFNTDNGRYVINSVGDYELILSREFQFPKSLVLKEWPNLWNNGIFGLPTGPQTGKSVQHAIANWIVNKIADCSENSFEHGWEILVSAVNEKRRVVVQKTQTYIIKGVTDDNETLTINVEARGKKRATLQRKFYESDETKVSKLESTLIGILKGYSKDFDEAWEKLKQIIEEGGTPVINDDANEQIDPQFLVIEEINRGNCAQIFGDIFQLLDRADNGFSVYPIEADSDLRDAIKTAFNEEGEFMLSKDIDIDGVIEYTSNYGKTLSEDVQEGRVLLFPPNFYIWATMNTSDQSLFPIDSAFKRRWDWVYTPIAQGKDKNGDLMNWQIEGLGDNSWWAFIQGINEVVDITTHSEDKKLGFFFCKAQDGVVKKETFVNKVVFYLWNDVFKVYGFKSEIFDKKDKDGKTEKITFKSFYNDDGSVNVDTMSVFVKNVMAKAPKTKADNENKDVNEEQNSNNETQA
ncbi:hypothetical protein PRMUPPPA20_08720 [Xylanibacter ruminicola]|uniref:Restriction endonuclease n=2 Tax=Xylanibacter ruminicola TaxID=839 RepID=D5EWX2_XYLR2|nr:restriction endonuclease [Xylanibacter ruminicola]ADE82326.1 putative restriction endonuclease [Xylanibacter ruminicola 23]GJG32763.1 hypothetical protein PRMUPPPA20_08720 [Xylanibacter ruminicola]SEH95405.1 hypothetical protein SAMN02745192_2452 [Xylanibacter ruminicola]